MRREGTPKCSSKYNYGDLEIAGLVILRERAVGDKRVAKTKMKIRKIESASNKIVAIATMRATYLCKLLPLLPSIEFHP